MNNAEFGTLEDQFRRRLALRSLRVCLGNAAGEWVMFEQVRGYDGEDADLLHDISEGLDAADKALQRLEAKYLHTDRIEDRGDS